MLGHRFPPSAQREDLLATHEIQDKQDNRSRSSGRTRQNIAELRCAIWSVAATDRSVRSCRAFWCAVTSREEPGGSGEAAAAGWPGGDLLRRQPAALAATRHQVFSTSRASAPSAALHALLRCPTDLASTAVACRTTCGRASACFGLGASGPGNLLRVVRAWRPCAPIASSSWPASGLGGCAARGRHWWCHGPGRGGRRHRHSGRGAGASTRDGAGYSPTSQSPRRIPGRSCRQPGGWQRCLRHPASQVGAPTRQAQRQGRQEAQGSTGQAQRPRERQIQKDQGERLSSVPPSRTVQVMSSSRTRSCAPCLHRPPLSDGPASKDDGAAGRLRWPSNREAAAGWRQQ
jgi:hypothetical protein